MSGQQVQGGHPDLFRFVLISLFSGPHAQYGWDFLEEIPGKFRKDPGIPLESTAGIPDPEGLARHLDASRQKLTPHCLAAIFDSRLPSPK